LFSGIYVRLESTTRRDAADLIDELRRFPWGEGFDEPPLPGLSSEDFVFRAATESFAPSALGTVAAIWRPCGS
jgi:hypothetical protein